MKLEGHQGPVLTCAFAPSGRALATAGKDKDLFFWSVYGEECENFAACTGHKNSVVSLCWSADGTVVCTASADKTLAMWDAEACKRVKKFSEHGSFVNACASAREGHELFASASDDATVRLWDMRVRRCVRVVNQRYPATAVALGDGNALFVGGVDDTIRAYDLRNGEESFTLEGHKDLITDLRVSRSGSHLLSNAMDATLRSWDVRPFVVGDQRAVRVFGGHKHGFEKNLLHCDWSADDSLVASGSSDRNVFVWDAETGEVRYVLPGHKGSVNGVSFHGTEPIIASAGSDGVVFLGEYDIAN